MEETEECLNNFFEGVAEIKNGKMEILNHRKTIDYIFQTIEFTNVMMETIHFLMLTIDMNQNALKMADKDCVKFMFESNPSIGEMIAETERLVSTFKKIVSSEEEVDEMSQALAIVKSVKINNSRLVDAITNLSNSRKDGPLIQKVGNVGSDQVFH